MITMVTRTIVERSDHLEVMDFSFA